MPHLEDLEEEDFYLLAPGDGHELEDSFKKFVSHAQDPMAKEAKNLLDTPIHEERKHVQDHGAADKTYWSSYVPKHYHEYGDVFSKKASE